MKQAGVVAGALGLGLVATTVASAAAPPASAPMELKTDQDVERFFGTVCGFCHVDGGRQHGRGPQLMGTKRSDEYMINRIATGKPGKMPAFGHSLTLDQIEAIVHYIRNLKPREDAAP
jgi:mono/diheme cytochrome c family protein